MRPPSFDPQTVRTYLRRHRIADLPALKQALGDQVTLYPYGGLLGNLWYSENREAILRYFR